MRNKKKFSNKKADVNWWLIVLIIVAVFLAVSIFFLTGSFKGFGEWLESTFSFVLGESSKSAASIPK